MINCDSPRNVEKYVFVTHLPCVACAKRLINMGSVKCVFYSNDYRTQDSVDLFKTVGIEVEKLSLSIFQEFFKMVFSEGHRWIKVGVYLRV